MEIREVESMAASLETPFYAFDEVEVARRVAAIRAALPDGVGVCYAMKANPFIVRAASRAADSIEVCSPGELRICRAAGIDDGQLVISGVHKDPELMRELVAESAQVHRFTVESVGQFELLESLAREAGVRVPLLVRVTGGNQFGMDPGEAMDLMRVHRENRHVDFRGIQFFSGTQKSSPKRIRRELEKLDGLVAAVERECGVAVAEVEYGPGLPVEYCDVDACETEARDQEFLGVLAESLANMDFAGKKTLEIGRGIAASCGTYVTRVVDVKRNRGVNYAIVDGGKHQLAFYGPALAMMPPACRVLPTRREPAAEGDQRWAVCGSLCTTNDILVKQVDVAGLRPGDCFAFPNTGAYCMTEGISLFLSRDLPSVYLVGESGEPRLARARIETDFINTPQDAAR